LTAASFHDEYTFRWKIAEVTRVTGAVLVRDDELVEAAIAA